MKQDNENSATEAPLPSDGSIASGVFQKHMLILKEQVNSILKPSNKKPLEQLVIWTVWYEDRFGTGNDRYPASLVALFLDKLLAEQYINDHEGPIDIQSGKYDGLFMKEWQAGSLIIAGLAAESDIQRLWDQEPPARLLAHWEKGWI